MVFLALTTKGLTDALHLVADSGRAIWCGADAISAEEFQSQRLPGVTRFDYAPGSTNGESVARALDTIAQHHPGETVWVEGAP
ncbi:MAG: hypothetical protein EOP24_46610 [Hyphomicrobiales bacterium]|nr:MAG: hypothetical protein EOP24_46610 [Hyphomicrobiales bacterium]